MDSCSTADYLPISRITARKLSKRPDIDGSATEGSIGYPFLVYRMLTIESYPEQRLGQPAAISNPNLFDQMMIHLL